MRLNVLRVFRGFPLVQVVGFAVEVLANLLQVLSLNAVDLMRREYVEVDCLRTDLDQRCSRLLYF